MMRRWKSQRRKAIIGRTQPDHLHFTVYGFRKGVVVDCTSATADSAPIVSVLNREEWSAGKVCDSYFHWANAGDEYVGQ